MLSKLIFFFFCLLYETKPNVSILHPEFQGKMQEYKIIPDLIDEEAEDMCTVHFSFTNIDLKPGQILNEDQVQHEPYIYWEYRPDRFYTVILTTPDGTKYEHAYLWLTVNVPGILVYKGDNVTEWKSPKAVVKDQRYVFLIYEQPHHANNDLLPKEKAVFEEITHRKKFSPKHFNLTQFVKKYNLQKPIAANFFLLRH